MTLQGSASAPAANTCPLSAAAERLIRDLRPLAEPLTEMTRTTLALVTPTETHWITVHAACPCSQSGASGIACQNGSHVAGRVHATVDITFQDAHVGTLLSCCDASASSVIPMVQQLARMSMHQIELEKEKEALCSDRDASGESLKAVHDISANLRSVQNAQDLLDHIFTRAHTHQQGLRVIVWVVNEEELEAVARKNVATVGPRPRTGGLVGDVLVSGAPIALSGRPALDPLVDRGAELQAAVSVAVLPILTQEEIIGVLEVWHEQAETKWDDRLMQFLATVASLAAMVIENERLRRCSVQTERLRRDIEIASRIQQTLLLGRPPLDLQLIRAAAISIPSAQIDGDFYDFYAHDQILDVVIGDVMGKGISAALVGAATKHQMLRAMNNLLSSRPTQLPDPKEILTIVNTELIKQLEGIERFVTLCYARFDLKMQRLELIDCGHTRTIHSHGRAGDWAVLQGDNMPLGFSHADIYEPIYVPFTPGDVFFFYSDGVTEAKSEAGAYFGETRLAELIHACNHLDPQEMVDKVHHEVDLFSNSKIHRDDLTCVAVMIQDSRPTLASIKDTLDITSDLAELPRVRHFLRELCRKQFNMDEIEEDFFKLVVAMTEAVSNVMIHGYHRQKDRPIRIRTDLFVNRLSIQIFHRGESFDPEAAEKRTSLDAPRENSMGLHIIRQYVDKVRYYSATHGENCIHLIKIFKQELKGDQRGPDA